MKIIKQGYFPTDNKILKAIQDYRGNRPVSGFMPCVAKSIYDKFCQNSDIVLDFCAGYGGRLFGAMACKKVKTYTGIEINFKTCVNLHNLYAFLCDYKQKPVTIINQDSILGMQQFADQTFDFCFTSPPYFDTEEYDDNKNQSSHKHEKYGEWFEEYLIKCVTEAKRVSKRVAINIANTGGYDIADDLEKWLKTNKISYDISRLKLPSYGKHKYEPIFIF